MTLTIARANDSYMAVTGASRSSQRFTDEMVERDHRVVVLTAGEGDADPHGGESGVEYVFFRGIPIPKSRKSMYIAAPNMVRAYRCFREHGVDVVHTDDFAGLSWASIIAARKLDIPVVGTAHFQSELLMPNIKPFDTALTKKVIDSISARYYNRCDVVVVPGVYSKNMLEDIGVRSRIEVLSNGVPAEVFRPMDNPSRKYRGERVILSVSRLNSEKNVDLIVRAMPSILEDLSDCRLVVVGQGAESGRLKELATELGVDDKVDFEGYVEQGDLPIYYNYADIFVSACDCETEGLTVLEAMSTGKPVVVSDADTNAARHLVGDNGLLFESGNTNSLSESLKHILSDASLAESMGDESRRVVEDRYSVKASADKLEDLYISLVQSG